MTSLNYLAHKVGEDPILGMEVTFSEKTIGKVAKLLRDKYGRLEGVEVEPAENLLLTIHYSRIAGIDEDRNVMIIT